MREPKHTLTLHATRPANAPSVWIGMVLLVAVVLLAEASFRDRSWEDNSVDLQVLVQLLLCGACGLYGLWHLPRTWPVLRRFPAAWGLLFGLWALATVPFAADKARAAVACFALWSVLCFAPAVLLRLGGRRTVLALLTGVLLLLAGSWLTFFALPELGVTVSADDDLEGCTRLAGLHHPNGNGCLAAMALALLLALGATRALRWRTLLAPLGFAVATLWLAGSRTAGLAALAVVAAAGLSQLSTKARAMLVCWTIVLAAVAIGWGIDTQSMASQASRTGDAHEIYTLTGRTELWGYFVDEILSSPLVGYGYGCSLYVTSEVPTGGTWVAMHAHNLFLDVMLATGVVGGLLVAAMFLAQLRGLLTCPQPVVDLLLVLVFVAGIPEAVLFNKLPTNAFTIAWLIALCWRQTGASLAGSTTASGIDDDREPIVPTWETQTCPT